MRRKFISRRNGYYLGALFVLLVGLAAACLIYVQAGDDTGDITGYEFINGESYAITLHDSKRYRHDLEMFGGKAAVFADDLNRWFSSLWHGRPLAVMLALLSVGVALILLRAARRHPPEGGD